MHEVSIALGLCRQLERVAREHGALKVQSFTVEVGELSNVVPQLLVEAFRAVKGEEALIGSAEIEIKSKPLTVRCRACSTTSRLASFHFQCPSCSSTRLEVLQGEELLLRDVELLISEEREYESRPSG